ncbi:hypothetical protein RD055328_13510 [Companilactobacillus sp. RD055328]|nr:hypothetical protein RD055328_13510 [Companilactobacillus sp. RD055328]
MKKYFLILNCLTLITVNYVVTLFKPITTFQTVMQFAALICTLITFVSFNKLIIKDLNIKTLSSIYIILPIIIIIIAALIPLIVIMK